MYVFHLVNERSIWSFNVRDWSRLLLFDTILILYQVLAGGLLSVVLQRNKEKK